MDKIELPYLKIPTVPTDFIEQLVAIVGGDAALPQTLTGRLKKYRQHKKVSGEQYIHFVEQIQIATQDEMLGIFDQKVAMGSSDVLCHMLRHSPDLSQALANYSRFYALFSHQKQPPILLEHTPKSVKIILNISNAKQKQPYFAYTILLNVTKLLCWLTGQRISPTRLYFALDLSALDSEFTYLFGQKPHYGATKTYIEFESAVLDYPIAPTIPAEDYVKQRMSYLLVWAVTESLERRVYALISDALMQGDFDIESIANQFHVSRHTMARRLRDVGTGYSSILERVRKDKAIALLRTTNNNLEQIATELGFSEARTLNRAFKGWTGQTPLEYRNQD